MFFLAVAHSDVLPLIVKFVVAVLGACNQLRHGAVLKSRVNVDTFNSVEQFNMHPVHQVSDILNRQYYSILDTGIGQ